MTVGELIIRLQSCAPQTEVVCEEQGRTVDERGITEVFKLLPTADGVRKCIIEYSNTGA